MDLRGKGILLTGATRGIGRETLKLLVGEGAKVAAVGRDEEALKEIRMAYGDAVFPIQANLSDPKQRERVVGMAAEVLGGLDVLINNAGFGIYGPFLNVPDDRMRELFEVNFWTPIHLTRLAVPFLHNGGVVLNVVSLIAFVPLQRWAIYSASKAALRSFFMAAREELRGEGIKVINVYPSVTRTDFFQRAGSDGIRGTGSVSPEKVAKVIVKALKRGKEEVFVSFWDGILAKIGFLAGPLATKLVK